jgi:alanine dehydrogenase
MPIYLDNNSQSLAITSSEAIEILEHGIREFAHGDALRRPRIDNLIPTSRPEEFFSFSSMEGGTKNPGYYALRIKPDIISWPMVNGMRRRMTYCHRPGLYGGLVFLFSVDTAELLAIMNDGYIQHLRVAATAAIGAKYLSRPEAKVMGIIGSGGMARSFADAFTVVRNLKTIKVFSPTRSHLEEFVHEVGAKVSAEVFAVDKPIEAVVGSDIVATCTNSYSPVIKGEWLKPGVHLANVMWWEIGPDVLERIDTAGLLVRRTPMSVAGYVDDDFGIRVDVMSYAAGTAEERARIPTRSKELFGIKTRSRYPNARYVDCIDWSTGVQYSRTSDTEITTLANNSFGTLEDETGPSSGIQGIQFATVGGRIYERARQLKIGRELPLDMFLQDIPT